MAEVLAALGAVASIAQLADYGFKLSTKLFAYSEAVSKANQTIKNLSSDVSLTSSVLKELQAILERDERRYVSGRAVEATHKTVLECFDVFDQLNKVLEKSMGGSGAAQKRDDVIKIGTFDKLRWPFVQPKMELLRSNLDRLKASLTLMLQVLMFAKDFNSREPANSTTTMQRQVIESLARAEKEATLKYLKLQERMQSMNASSVGYGDVPPPYITNVANVPGGPTPGDVREDREIEPLVGDVTLCLDLTDKVLASHLRNLQPYDSSYERYSQLRQDIETARKQETASLEQKYGNAAIELVSKTSKDVEILQDLLSTITSNYESMLTWDRVTPVGRAQKHEIDVITQPQSAAAPHMTPVVTYSMSEPVLEHTESTTFTVHDDIRVDVSDGNKATPYTISFPIPAQTRIGAPRNAQQPAVTAAIIDPSASTKQNMEQETLELGDDIVDRLLAEWTTLPGGELNRSSYSSTVVPSDALRRPSLSKMGFDYSEDDIRIPGRYPEDIEPFTGR